MKGVAFRKLSRTSGHRNHLLRNLVTSLFQHERISTTVAKAKEAQREAEKIITKLKKAAQNDRRGADQQWHKALGYVFDRETTSPILKKLAERYAERPGGYTRLHLFGNRPGDHAPRALLELVDNDKGDLRLEMTARAMGREALLSLKRKSKGALSSRPDTQIFSNPSVELENDTSFNELTRLNISKVVKYTSDAKRAELYNRADEHFRRLVVMEEMDGPRRSDEAKMSTDEWEKNGPKMDPEAFVITPTIGRQYKASVQLDDLPIGSGQMEDQNGRPIPGARILNQPQPSYGKKKNSVIRLGKGSFAKRVDYRVNPSSYRGARGVSARS
ncbi:unnamed protein product [Sympodiomycopsis kandeliae]